MNSYHQIRHVVPTKRVVINAKHESTDTMVPNGAIITDINEHCISDATSATEIHDAIRDARGDVLVTVRMRTSILVGGGRGDVAARADNNSSTYD